MYSNIHESMSVAASCVLTAALAVAVGCGRAIVAPEAAEAVAVESEVVQPTVVTEDNFQEEVLEAEGLVLVDFWATWCGPCRMIAPALKELAVEYEGRVKIGKLDVDKNPELAKTYEARRIPYLVMFKDGKAIDAKVGADRKANYAKWFDEHL